MWILPNNHSLSSAFAQAMVESKEDLTWLESSIESSLMWRSKPSLLRTWLRRWNRVSWIQPLFTRILKPSHHTSFEEQLTLSLEDIRANRSARQANEKAKKILDICGLTSTTTSSELDPTEYSSRTSRDMLTSVYRMSSTTWQDWVTIARGEYSQRLKLAHPTKESGSSSWATPNTMDYLPQRSEEALRKQASTARKGRTRPANLREQVNPRAVEIYKEVNWPTPRASEYKDCGPVGSKSQIHMDKRSYLCARVKDPDKPSGCLNPTWTEWLMGVPTGWTELGSWGTESCLKQQQEPGKC